VTVTVQGLAEQASTSKRKREDASGAAGAASSVNVFESAEIQQAVVTSPCPVQHLFGKKSLLKVD
jgi:hypothetical protein